MAEATFEMTTILCWKKHFVTVYYLFSNACALF